MKNVKPYLEYMPSQGMTMFHLFSKKGRKCSDGDIQWVDDVFPPTIEQLLSNEICENESDSDDEEIKNIEDEGIYGSDIDSDYETFH